MRASRNCTNQQRMLVIAAILSAAATLALRWPGELTTDTQTQLGEAIHGSITDWHPPITPWLWRLIGTTSGAMLTLQVALHWFGIACLALSVNRAGSARWAWIMLLVGLSPISLFFITVIQKDMLLTSFFIAAFGLAALVRNNVAPGALGFVGTLARWNGIFAFPALFFVRRPTVSLVGMLTISAVAVAVLIPVTSFINHDVLMARRTGVERSLQFYDLAGIAHYSATSRCCPSTRGRHCPATRRCSGTSWSVRNAAMRSTGCLLR